MLINVIEKLGKFFQVKRNPIEEVNEMKLKCNFCIIQNGNAIKTENLYLRHWRGRDYLVCRKHKTAKVIDRRRYAKRNDNFN